jgi:GT2 family glycosyltransferase
MILKNNTLTFVIVNYKSIIQLQKCLKDLSKVNGAHFFNLIIVNNDKEKITLPKNIFYTQKILEVNKNIGFGKACNKGLSKTTSEFICFLNPDTHSFCNNFADIINTFTNNKTIISPKILTPTNDVEPWSIGTNLTLLQTIKNHIGLQNKQWLSNQRICVDWISGASMFAKTVFIKDLGGFDEDFFLYFEDVDLCKRAKNNGGQIFFEPNFFLTHTNGNSSKKDIQKQKRCYYNSQDLFFKKHLPTAQKHLLRFCRFLYLK